MHACRLWGAWCCTRGHWIKQLLNSSRHVQFRPASALLVLLIIASCCSFIFFSLFSFQSSLVVCLSSFWHLGARGKKKLCQYVTGHWTDINWPTNKPLMFSAGQNYASMPVKTGQNLYTFRFFKNDSCLYQWSIGILYDKDIRSNEGDRFEVTFILETSHCSINYQLMSLLIGHQNQVTRSGTIEPSMIPNQLA